MAVPVTDIQKWKNTALENNFTFDVQEGWNPVLDLNAAATAQVFQHPHTRPANMQNQWRKQRNHVVREMRGTVKGAVGPIRRLTADERYRLASGLLAKDQRCRTELGRSSRYYPELADAGTMQGIINGTGVFVPLLCGDQHPKVVAGDAAAAADRFHKSINYLERHTLPPVQIDHYATQLAKDATCKVLFNDPNMIYDRGGYHGSEGVQASLALSHARQGSEFRTQSCRPYNEKTKSSNPVRAFAPGATILANARIPQAFRAEIRAMRAPGRKTSQQLNPALVHTFEPAAMELYGRKIVSRLARVPLHAAVPLVHGPLADRYTYTNTPSGMGGYDAFNVFNVPVAAVHPPPPLPVIVHPPPPLPVIVHHPPPPPVMVHPSPPPPSGGVGRLFGTHCSGKVINFTRPGFF
jgi:hypothetical protein